MALDVSLLYGEMVASAILHVAIVFAIYMLISSLQMEAGVTRLLLFLGACVLISWGVQAILLAILQASGNGGVKSFSSVAVGATVAAAITAAMMAIPMFIEPARLVVSSLFMMHHAVDSSAVAEAVVEAAATVSERKVQAGERSGERSVTSTVGTGTSLQAGGGGQETAQEAFDKQSLKEIAFGAGFWGAFAGAYGVGVGSLM